MTNPPLHRPPTLAATTRKLRQPPGHTESANLRSKRLPCPISCASRTEQCPPGRQKHGWRSAWASPCPHLPPCPSTLTWHCQATLTAARSAGRRRMMFEDTEEVRPQPDESLDSQKAAGSGWRQYGGALVSATTAPFILSAKMRPSLEMTSIHFHCHLFPFILSYLPHVPPVQITHHSLREGTE